MSAVPEPTESRTRVPRWVPGALALLGVGCTLVAIALGLWLDAGRPVSPDDAALGLLYPLVAALVLRRQPGNRVGWLLMTTAVTGPYLLAGEYVVAQGAGAAGRLASFAVWISAWGFTVPYFVIIGLVPLYFPTGELPSRRWRPAAVAVTACVVLGTVGGMLRSTSDISDDLANPLSIGVAADWALRLGAFGCFLLGTPIGVAALVVRMRRSRGAERTQLQWLVLGVAVLLVTTVASLVVDVPVLSTTSFAVGVV